MALLASNAVRTGLQVVLAIVILVLGYLLYQTIVGPQQEFEREQALTETSRERMSYLRKALVGYEREYDAYPASLGELETILRSDSLFVASRDSILEVEEGEAVNLDSLTYSSRGGRFEYRVAEDDSAGTRVYLLRDPVTGDSIGTSNPARATGLLNAASWE